MNKLIYSTVVAALTCGFAASASASVCTGNCGTMGANGVVTAAPIGNGDYQYVSTSGGATGVGSLNVSGVNQTNGSLYVSDSFSASAGDSLHFYFNYVTSDGSGSYTDYAWAALRPTDGGADIILFTARTTPTGNTVPGFGLPGLADGVVLDPASTPIIPGAPTWSALGSDSGSCYTGGGCGYTGWIGMDYLFADGGLYSLVFGVTNVGDTAYASGLAFAGLTVNDKPIDGTVPEPATLTLMLAGLGLAGALRRRNKKAPTA
ncbi:MAG: NF038132 family protein [Azonexus sp.]|jgi:hypothetical protein|uniref:NF038132 family protein n=1 Tax=Azonexus sp. TaxID=1872668 RepID=UPI00281F10C5|nr:NF038132 family protein [Azonexus sp.]MDR0775236.1 NF038132 family protein [Azonexus sp.]